MSKPFLTSIEGVLEKIFSFLDDDDTGKKLLTVPLCTPVNLVMAVLNAYTLLFKAPASLIINTSSLLKPRFFVCM